MNVGQVNPSNFLSALWVITNSSTTWTATVLDYGTWLLSQTTTNTIRWNIRKRPRLTNKNIPEVDFYSSDLLILILTSVLCLCPTWEMTLFTKVKRSLESITYLTPDVLFWLCRLSVRVLSYKCVFKSFWLLIPNRSSY